jgi:hypothetical protein
MIRSERRPFLIDKFYLYGEALASKAFAASYQIVYIKRFDYGCSILAEKHAEKLRVYYVYNSLWLLNLEELEKKLKTTSLSVPALQRLSQKQVDSLKHSYKVLYSADFDEDFYVKNRQPDFYSRVMLNAKQQGVQPTTVRCYNKLICAAFQGISEQHTTVYTHEGLVMNLQEEYSQTTMRSVKKHLDRLMHKDLLQYEILDNGDVRLRFNTRAFDYDPDLVPRFFSSFVY